MKTNVNQRLNEVVEYLIYSKAALDKTDLSKKLGYNASSFSQIINGRVPIADRFIGRLLEFAPYINREWLVEGTGTMLKVPAATMSPYPADEMVSQATPTEAMRDGVNVITDAEVLDLSNYPVEVIEELRTEIKKDEAVPIISAEVAACDKYDISEYLEEDNELEHFIPSDMTADVDGAEIVRKTSMLPTFAPNDVVFIKLIKDKTRITDGGTYYFKLRKRATMIRMAKIKGNELRLIAQNPQFGDVITTFDDVINVASIEGLYRKNIANQYNEIEALRRRKDAQTDELIKCNGDLIKQNGDALKIVDRLVSVIEKKQ